ncbi:MATE family efflux transporter [Chitinophaga deserti]|uniref:polysaccharide biosynthesis protein n=1 Tax=Chitinophaga deserti TaxID=2164099 RepID=UPI000D6DBE7A|nr:polysaccharide biosynthesis protein [Chitinophaga deserti]
MGRYLKIYFWQVVSLIFNLASVFVVTPFISSNQALYGIYSIAIAAFLFLSYADLGFLSAGMKYSAESYAKGDRESEVKTLGFAGMVFMTFVAVYSAVMLYFSFTPTMLIPNLKAGEEIIIAQRLLLILAIFAPALVLQRIVQIIFGIRLQDYKFQRILIIFNVLKVTSAFYFFGNGHYSIIGYFLFSQFCTLLAAVIGLYKAKKELDYDIKGLFRSFRFSRDLYKKTSKLAFSSLFLTFCWILYYELDPFVIGRIMGADLVAVYAIGLTVLTYFRSLFGILFTPFIARFNHFIGLQDNKGLQEILVKILALFIPVTMFPVIAISITSRNFVYTWVGETYSASVEIMQVLLLCYVFSFITYPGGILLMARERVKTMYITSGIQPLVYWTGIFLTFQFLGLAAFAWFKLLAFAVSATIYCISIRRFLQTSWKDFIIKILLPAVPPVGLLAAICLFLRKYLPLSHTKLSFITYITIIVFVILLATACYYITSNIFRQFVNQMAGTLSNRIKNMKLGKLEK